MRPFRFAAIPEALQVPPRPEGALYPPVHVNPTPVELPSGGEQLPGREAYNGDPDTFVPGGGAQWTEVETPPGIDGRSDNGIQGANMNTADGGTSTFGAPVVYAPNPQGNSGGGSVPSVGGNCPPGTTPGLPSVGGGSQGTNGYVG